MRALRRLCGLLAASGSVLVIGCSDNTERAKDVGAATERTGSALLDLRLATGETIDSATYVITGPGGFSRNGTIDLSHTSTLSATIGGLPAGSGYSITITGAAGDSGTMCAGSATFNVVAHATATVLVKLSCHEPPRLGSANVNGALNLCPVIDGLGTTVSEVILGRSIGLTAAAHDVDAAPTALSYQWSTTLGKLDNPTSAHPTLTCTAAGSATVSLIVSDGDCTDTASLSVTCSPFTPPPVVINEVESNGGVPGDWAELYNAGSAPVDMSGWIFKDNDDTHNYVIPAGTVIAPGGYYLLEEAAFGFGLGAADATRLWDDTGIALVDSYSWTAHATTTYGRCPNGTGAFVTTGSSTKGGPNDCSTGATDAGATDAGATDAQSDAADAGDSATSSLFPWPGPDDVGTVDNFNYFGTNLSDLFYQPATGAEPTVLWAVQNSPSKVFKLVFDGTVWAPTSSDGWGSGKLIHYTNGLGSPDSEGLTKPDVSSPFVYVATERDNSANTVSRLSVLRYDTSPADGGPDMTATNDWNLTSDIPVVGPNLGLEAITFIPDTFLVANQFVDESTGTTYDPSRYPNHAGGIFFVGVEGNGIIYGYALDHVGGSFQRVATFSSGQASIMSLQFDRDFGNLWSYCDNTCGNHAGIFQLDTGATSPTRGHFVLRRLYDHPSTTLPNSNNEGITFAPEAECSGGFKSFFWTDDDQINGHAIRRGRISCGPLF